MFEIRDEVVPIFNIKELGGDVYIIDDMYNRGFPTMFLGYVPNSGKMYTFNCSDVKRGKWAEYVIFETSFDMILRSATGFSEAREIMKDAKELYIYVVDCRGYYDIEKNKYETLYDYYIPNSNTYFLYNRETISGKKKKD